MHPGFIGWWHARREAMRAGGCVSHAGGGCGPGGGGGHARHQWAQGHGGGDDSFDGGSFGVRRPLRFLAYKLELDDKQVDALARVLDELKTERAQAAVDHRRTTSAIAEAVAAETFDAAAVAKAAAARVESAERLRDAVVKALQGMHAILNADQRAKLAYLLRTGTLSI
jgi:Spy/CpxP family protein refolding chaperone